MIWRKILLTLKWILTQFDVILALLIGIVCSVLGLIGAIQLPILMAAILGILSIIAFSSIKDRLEREKLQSSITRLVMKPTDNNPENFLVKESNETTILQDVEKEIFMIQETGTNVIETSKATIISLLKKGGEIKIVVTCPINNITALLSLRNCDFSPEDIKNRHNLFSSYINNIVSSVYTEKLQLRFSPYVIDTSSVFVDPNSPLNAQRKALIRFPGFRIPFEERIGMTIEGKASPKLFNHYYQEAQNLFTYTYKFIVYINLYAKNNLVFDKITEEVQIEDRAHLFFLKIKPTFQNNKQVGFDVITSNDSIPQTAISFLKDGTYKVNTAIWEAAIIELEIAHRERKILILDGIGIFQLRDKSFFKIFETIFADPTSTMFISLALKDQDGEDVVVKRIKSHYRSTIIYLTSLMDIDTEATMAKEINSSILLAQLLINH